MPNEVESGPNPVGRPEAGNSDAVELDPARYPTVSLCTVTYNRSAFLPLLQRHILAQTYPRSRMEWVLVDDSDDAGPEFQPDQSQGLKIVYKRLESHLPLGSKRNLSHRLCSGEIIIYLDDDDYYPPTRVAHAVERLLGSEALVAGSTILPILFLPERQLWVAGPYGPNHATAGTFAFKRQLLEQTRYDDEKTFAEEKSFLKDYTFPMVQLDPGHTILCIGHDRNTFEKRALITAGKNPRFRQAERADTDRVLGQLAEILPRYEGLLAPEGSRKIEAKPPPASELVVRQSSVSVTRLQREPQLSAAQVRPEVQASLLPALATEDVNICIVSHPEDSFSLCFLDVARYLRYRLRLIDGVARIRISKDQLCRDAVNLVLGAHVGFDAENCKRYRCVIVNLEQLGATGKQVRPGYIELLRQHAVLDYDQSNVAAYRDDPRPDVAILSFGYAPYLQSEAQFRAPLKPLKERSIDILFYGSMNAGRLQMLRRLAGQGVDIKVLENLFGPERDELIRDAKLVLNVAYYEKGTFEQVRAFHCLSLGTPLLSIVAASTAGIPAQYRDAVFFMKPDEAAQFLASTFKTDAFYAAAQQKLQAFRMAPFEQCDAEQAQLRQLLVQVARQAPPSEAQPYRRINLGCGTKYLPGWINVDINEAAHPDLLLDLCRPIDFPLQLHSPCLGGLTIRENSIERLLVDNVLEHVSDLPQLMTNCLRLLAVGGQIEIVVPYEKSHAAWQDPTHVRALNERSWIYCTDWAWRLGWFAHRFKLDSFAYLDAHAKGVLPDASGAFFLRVLMTKQQVPLKERNRYRLLRSDFGLGLDDDPG